MKMNKQGQEEIVGFVLIVVIMTVVLLIVLGLSLKGNGTQENLRESKDVAQFLGSAMEYTSSCAISYEPAYSKMSELVNDCYSSSNCVSGEQACDVLRNTMTNILDSSWKVGEDRPIKGYVFSASYGTNSNSTEVREFVKVTKGECKSTIKGAEYLIPAYPGTITSILKICY